MTFNCRICFEEDKRKNLISPCLCSGNIKYTHSTCLDKWRNMNILNTTCCEICKEKFIIETIEIKNKNYISPEILYKIELFGIIFLMSLTPYIIGAFMNFFNFNIKFVNNEIINNFVSGILFIMFAFGFVCYYYMIYTNNYWGHNHLYYNPHIINNNMLLFFLVTVGLFIVLYNVIKFIMVIRKRFYIHKNLVNKYVVKDREIIN